MPILIRRIAQIAEPQCWVEAPPGIRVPRGTLVKAGEVERATQLAAMHANPDGAVLILVDADDDCPAEIGPELLQRAAGASPGLAIGLVLAKYEFENWFIAAADSIRGRRGLAADLTRILKT